MHLLLVTAFLPRPVNFMSFAMASLAPSDRVSRKCFNSVVDHGPATRSGYVMCLFLVTASLLRPVNLMSSATASLAPRDRVSRKCFNSVVDHRIVAARSRSVSRESES